MPGIGQFSISDWRKLLTILRDPWTDFTPTMTQTVGLSITVTYARYRIVGKVAHVQALVTITSAGTASGIIAFESIPAAIALKNTGTLAVCGHGLYNTAAGTIYTLEGVAATSSVCRLFSSGSTSFFGTNPAVTAANGDVFSLDLMYEIAA